MDGSRREECQGRQCEDCKIRSWVWPWLSHNVVCDFGQTSAFQLSQMPIWGIGDSLSYKIHKSVMKIKKKIGKYRNLYNIWLYSHFEGYTDLRNYVSDLHCKYIDLFYKCGKNWLESLSGNGRIVGGYKWKGLRYNLEEEFSKKKNFFFFIWDIPFFPQTKSFMVPHTINQ